MNRTEILEQADRLISHDRAIDYGEAERSFGQIAALWTIMTGHQFQLADVARCMIALKLVRLNSSPGKSDSWVDIAGYAALGGEIAMNVAEGDET